MKRIGILGGTFDPPHIGHLIIAEEVRIALDLTEVWFIPTYEPPHKDRASSSVEDRLNMLQRAIGEHPHFKINTIEIERSGKSYTIDTMKTFKRMYPEDEFFFIIGADMVEYLPNWFKIEELIKLVTFVGVKRPGFNVESDYPVVEVDIPIIDISSTTIRSRLARKQSIKYLTPDAVISYIKERQLYGTSGSIDSSKTASDG
ncbi:MAG TPA: nicotinate-nucleotide adenylyltransferase [Bacillota bacterium]|nr:nicotinate-nucleotide adenylyltransferase [Bacillota bacterium]